ncbi:MULTISPECIES: DUF3566 domain-containing protein [Mobiluncus]|uniref:DUF3566 domain-containing protein n=2 Tax=Mobiluncus TaxID=2050 RepID=E6M5M8_9ACTO|nr:MULTISPECIES: DUF3566 domain-containing protein [Mobiluncus]EFL93488.1 hypothetical protein HMPREF0574_1218 [Mobiluncus curtisii subsp. curtisii ATCC 35241]EFU81776.1 hypothetical protein HMPREF0576_1618 [Mobiluncus holmesii ATCC 35242]MCU9988056.1 DUF3566 domain-containing protein [Mobiluncus curtisii]MCV0001274.1 DUF3566 domain-containing protein [Mobiluncus curtisii]MCV0020585.1 DUF3566 domain-containing protein [Mobiluncus curtisii]
MRINGTPDGNNPAPNPDAPEDGEDPSVSWARLGHADPYSGALQARDNSVKKPVPPPPMEPSPVADARPVAAPPVAEVQPDMVPPEPPAPAAPAPVNTYADERAAAKAAKKAEREAAREARRLEAAKRMREREEAADLPDVRRVKLILSRVNPLSAMKIGFLVAVAMSIVMLVAAIVLWLVLDMLHVFSSMQGFLQALSATALVNLVDALTFSRTIALVAIFGVLQIIILTVLSWLAAVIYNLIARMVGGLHVVMTDD